MKKEKYKKVPETSKWTIGIPNIFCLERTHRFEPKIEQGKRQTDSEEMNNNLLIELDPDLKDEIFPDNNDILKCRVRFYSKEGTHTITKIHQHIGGEYGNTRMKITEFDTNEEIDGGWDKPTIITINKDEVKGLMLVFYRIGDSGKDHVGVQIETSEAIYTTDFYIRWDIK